LSALKQIECADKLGVLTTTPKRVKIMVGGRASTKSTFAADYVASMVSHGQRWCCTREYQNSIDDSVHSLLTDEVERCDFQGFKVNAKDIDHVSGGKIFYKGLARNITSIKSIVCDGLWIEEGEGLSHNSLKVLTASVRVSAAQAKKAQLAGTPISTPEIWITMNRGSSADPIAKKFLERAEPELQRCGFYEDDVMMIVEVNWNDNPWFKESGLEPERLDDEKYMSRAEYDHKWNGAYSDEVPNSIIKAEWFDACIDAHKIDKLKKVFTSTGAKIAAHDPSDGGSDDKGLAVRHGSIITHVSSMNHGEVDEGCAWAVTKARDLGIDWFVWDGDGMGTGLKHQVNEAFEGTPIKYHMFRGSLSGKGQDNAEQIYMPAEGDKDTAPKNHAETFYNNRAQYYGMLRDLMYNTYRCVVRGEYVDPIDMISLDSDGIENVKGLRSEICRVPSKPNNRGLLQIMNKQEMAKLGIKSPNEADSVMMTLFKPKVTVKHVKRKIKRIM